MVFGYLWDNFNLRPFPRDNLVKKLDRKYGLGIALELLIEYIISDISEIKFLTTTTCFPLD